MSSSDKPSPQSPSPSGKDIAIVFLLYVVCLGGALAARMFAGPYFGLAAACAAIVVWVRFGPAPFPGLLPGLMALTVAMLNVGVIVTSVVTILRQMGG